MQLDPNSMSAHAVLGWSYTEQKKFAGAISEMETHPESRAASLCTGALSAVPTRFRETESRLKKSSRNSGVPTHHRAASGLRWPRSTLPSAIVSRPQLEHSGPGDIQANWLRLDPAFDSIRVDPSFIVMVNQIGVDRAEQVTPK